MQILHCFDISTDARGACLCSKKTWVIFNIAKAIPLAEWL